jgi:hypothetical protein
MEPRTDLRDMINKIVESRVDASRRYIDEVLDKVEDRNRQYFLERLGYELRELELAEQNRNLHLVLHHRVMADTYRSILENCFPV